MKKLTFACLGSLTQDVYLYDIDGLTPVCQSPEDCDYRMHLGDKIYVNQINFASGGGASNAATTFARNGQKSIFVGVVGCDPSGAAAVADLTRYGVHVEHIVYSKYQHTDYSTLFLSPNGERTILTYRGCGQHAEPWQFDLSRIKDPIDWIYMTSMVGNFTVYEKIIAQARDRNIKIAFNPGQAELRQPDQLKNILRDITILSLNREEASQIVKGDTIEQLLRNLKELCPVAIITDGPNGAVAADHSGALRAGLYNPGHESIDRTGAGDAFCSGFTLQYALGAGLKTAIKFASANATAAVSRIGSKTGLLENVAPDQLDSMDISDIKL